MRKYILTFIVMCGVAIAGTASASLWSFFQEQGQPLPSVEERADKYSEVSDAKYKGTYEQNLIFEDYLREMDEEMLGSTLPVAGMTYTLAGSGITASATSITVSSLTIPQTGYKLLDANFSDTFYITLEPGSTKRQEIASCTTVTQNANGSATLSGCSRGLLPYTPFTASTTYDFPHAGGTQLIFSDPPQLFNEYPAKSNDETITGTWDFSDNLPTAPTSTPTSVDQLVTLFQMNQATSTGGTDATETTKGIGEFATQAEMALGTATGSTGANLFLFSKYASSTGGKATTTIPITNTSGKLNANFGGSASSIATLDSNTLVVQNPANATTTPTAGKIPINSSKLPWLPASPVTNTIPYYTGSAWGNVSTTVSSTYLRNSTSGILEFGAIGDVFNFTPLRTENTVYTNTSTGSRLISITVQANISTAGAVGQSIVYVSATSTPSTPVAETYLYVNDSGNDIAAIIDNTMTFIVPPNYYYRAVDEQNTSIKYWVEYSL